jgi:acyl-CoA thioesterase FadM
MKAGRIGGKSVTLECVITKTDKKGERPTAKGTNIIVAFDYRQNVSVPIPEDWKKAMEG